MRHVDADEPGQKATQEALEIAKRHSVPVVEFRGHIHAGVKDLHKLLLFKEESFHIEAGRCMGLLAEFNPCPELVSGSV